MRDFLTLLFDGIGFLDTIGYDGVANMKKDFFVRPCDIKSVIREMPTQDVTLYALENNSNKILSLGFKKITKLEDIPEETRLIIFYGEKIYDYIEVYD